MLMKVETTFIEIIKIKQSKMLVVLKVVLEWVDIIKI